VASLARALGVDAGELEPSVDPPAPAGDLKAELAAFTTVDACVAQRAAGDPVVGDALEAIGYDTLIRDACRLLDAAKSQDAKRCADIIASTLKARCEASVAELAAQPEACPFERPSHPELGRDAACLALATRDSRLCAGAFDRTARATCEAIATHDGAPCKKLPLRSDQARCARDEQRWASVLPVRSATPEAGSGEAIGGSVLSNDEGFDSQTHPLDVSRGVVIFERFDGTHFVVGTLSDGSAGAFAPSLGAAGTFGVEILVPRDAKTSGGCADQAQGPACNASVVSLQQAYIVSEHPAATRPFTTVSGTQAKAFRLRLRSFEKRRGGRIDLELAGPDGAGSKVRVILGTFVRDVVTAKAMYGDQRFGDAGFLR
jgi:hypothetical protein